MQRWAATSSRTSSGSSPARSTPSSATPTAGSTRRPRSTAAATSSPIRRPACRSTTRSKGNEPRFALEKGWNYIGKLTFLITSDHRLSVSSERTPTSGGGDGDYPLRIPGLLQLRAPPNAGTYNGSGFNAFNLTSKNDSLNVTAELNSSFLDKRLLLDVRVGWHHQLDEAFLPTEAISRPAPREPSPGRPIWSPAPPTSRTSRASSRTSPRR